MQVARDPDIATTTCRSNLVHERPRRASAAPRNIVGCRGDLWRAPTLTYSFTPKVIQVAAGADVTLALTTSDLPHDITIEGLGHVAHVSDGKAARGGLKIMKPGTYVFYCSVKGHRAQGMTGKIIVS